jgi:Asp-tRNA(Asn)/Glu-tRNA(Gln) amidotransferase B subunit
MPFLSLLGGKTIVYLIAGLLIAAVVGGFWIHYGRLVARAEALQAANAKQAQQLDTMAEINEQNLSELAGVKADRAAAQKIAAAEIAAMRSRTAAAEKIAKELRNVQASDDGPVAAIVNRVLAELRGDAGTGKIGNAR